MINNTQWIKKMAEVNENGLPENFAYNLYSTGRYVSEELIKALDDENAVEVYTILNHIYISNNIDDIMQLYWNSSSYTTLNINEATAQQKTDWLLSSAEYWISEGEAGFLDMEYLKLFDEEVEDFLKTKLSQSQNYIAANIYDVINMEGLWMNNDLLDLETIEQKKGWISDNAYYHMEYMDNRSAKKICLDMEYIYEIGLPKIDEAIAQYNEDN